MTTKMTANGVSTTTTPGTEQYEVFYTGYRTRRKKHYQYDYRRHRRHWRMVIACANQIISGTIS